MKPDFDFENLFSYSSIVSRCFFGASKGKSKKAKRKHARKLYLMLKEILNVTQ